MNPLNTVCHLARHLKVHRHHKDDELAQLFRERLKAVNREPRLTTATLDARFQKLPQAGDEEYDKVRSVDMSTAALLGIHEHPNMASWFMMVIIK